MSETSPNYSTPHPMRSLALRRLKRTAMIGRLRSYRCRIHRSATVN